MLFALVGFRLRFLALLIDRPNEHGQHRHILRHGLLRQYFEVWFDEFLRLLSALRPLDLRASVFQI